MANPKDQRSRLKKFLDAAGDWVLGGVDLDNIPNGPKREREWQENEERHAKRRFSTGVWDDLRDQRGGHDWR